MKEQDPPKPTGPIDALVSELKSQCNRYANGFCGTFSCLKRGGYQRGNKPDYETATCERHEQVKALEAVTCESKNHDTKQIKTKTVRNTESPQRDPLGTCRPL